jgi:hypothetical protein
MADDAAPAPTEPRPVGRPSKYEPRFCDMVVEDMAKGYSLTAFAGLIGVCKDTINAWTKEFPEFSDAVSRGKALRVRDWETVGLEMRTKGGGPGGATIVVFGLKNMGGDEWSDTSRTVLTGPNGGALQHEHSADAGFLAVAATVGGHAARPESGLGDDGGVAGQGEA